METPKLKAAEDPKHPKLAKIREALERNPRLTISHLQISYSVARNNILAWEKKGWIKLDRNSGESKRRGFGARTL
jgi:hypothetical protein